MQIRKFFLKFILNLFPPLLFNRIVLKEISDDFSEMKVILKKSLFNMNFHRTIFGGSIFSACDPYLPTMYYHIFSNKKRKLIIWLKAGTIQYLKPATSSLKIHFKITKEEIEMAENALDKNGKFEIWHSVDAINEKGEVCVNAKMQIYLRDNNNKKKLGF